MSVPFERGHFSGLETQFTALETQGLRSSTIAIEEYQIRQFLILAPFLRARR